MTSTSSSSPTGGAVNALQPFELGIGTWAWGDAKWGYGESYTEEDLYGAFSAAMDNNLTFFDTAEVYGTGKSEELIGRCIRKYAADHPSAPKPFIATKFLPFPWRVFQSSMEAPLRASLARLGLESVDLYQVHGPATSVRGIEVWAHAMADLHEKGLVKSVGVSNYNIDQVRRTHRVLAERGIQLESNQIEFSLLRRNPELNGHIAECQALGVKVIAYSPLGMGRLTGKYSRQNPPPGKRKFGDQPWEKLEPLLEKLKQIAAKHDKTSGQVALNWCICKGTIPICGAKNDKQTLENRAAQGWKLTDEDIAALDSLSLEGSGNFWQENS